jgi:hypothetical protein
LACEIFGLAQTREFCGGEVEGRAIGFPRCDALCKKFFGFRFITGHKASGAGVARLRDFGQIDSTNSMQLALQVLASVGYVPDDNTLIAAVTLTRDEKPRIDKVKPITQREIKPDSYVGSDTYIKRAGSL